MSFAVSFMQNIFFYVIFFRGVGWAYYSIFLFTINILNNRKTIFAVYPFDVRVNMGVMTFLNMLYAKTYPFLFVTIVLVFWFVQFGANHMFMVAAIINATIIVLVMGYPLILMRNIVYRKKTLLIEKIHRNISKSNMLSIDKILKIPNMIASDPEDIVRLSSQIDAVNSLCSRVLNLPTWPINLRLGGQVALMLTNSIGVPILLAQPGVETMIRSFLPSIMMIGLNP